MKNQILIGLTLCILSLIIIYPAQAFEANHIDYIIYQNSTALITVDYQLSSFGQFALNVPTVQNDVGQELLVMSLEQIPDYST